MKIKITKSSLLFIFSILLIIAIMAYIGIYEIFKTLISANPIYVILAVVLQIIVSILLSVR